MPRLSMVRMAALVRRRRTKRFSLSTQKRWVWRLGRKRRRVLLFACDTVFPVIGRLPVTWHTLDMILAPKNESVSPHHGGEPRFIPEQALGSKPNSLNLLLRPAPPRPGNASPRRR